MRGHIKAATASRHGVRKETGHRTNVEEANKTTRSSGVPRSDPRRHKTESRKARFLRALRTESYVRTCFRTKKGLVDAATRARFLWIERVLRGGKTLRFGFVGVPRAKSSGSAPTLLGLCGL
jgi:hypothetical protein